MSTATYNHTKTFDYLKQVQPRGIDELLLGNSSAISSDFYQTEQGSGAVTMTQANDTFPPLSMVFREPHRNRFDLQYQVSPMRLVADMAMANEEPYLIPQFSQRLCTSVISTQPYTPNINTTLPHYDAILDMDAPLMLPVSSFETLSFDFEPGSHMLPEQSFFPSSSYTGSAVGAFTHSSHGTLPHYGLSLPTPPLGGTVLPSTKPVALHDIARTAPPPISRTAVQAPTRPKRKREAVQEDTTASRPERKAKVTKKGPAPEVKCLCPAITIDQQCPQTSKQERSGYEDLPAPNDALHFCWSRKPGPMKCETREDQLTSSGGQPKLERYSCPFPGCSKTFARPAEAERHVWTSSRHEFERSMDEWAERYGIPKDSRHKLQTCRFRNCRKYGVYSRRDSVNSHMLNNHGISIAEWESRATFLIRRERKAETWWEGKPLSEAEILAFKMRPGDEY